MEVITLDRAEILIPNAEHGSFSGSNKFIEEGKILNGDIKLVEGKRRGKPFSYRLFKTKDNNYINLNKVNMKAREVTLGADGTINSPTIINTTKGKVFSKIPMVGAVAGAGLGYWYCKHKAHDTKKTMLYTLFFAAAGYGIGKFIERQKAITVNPSK